MTNKPNFFAKLEEEIRNTPMPDVAREFLLKQILRLRDNQVNIMITGATGAGKSSTINALFDMSVAKVGTGVDPETMDIKKYELGNLILWDTPGLGDGKEADTRHAKNIISKLAEYDEQGNALIDLVLVILDGGSRDLGTSYELINEVIIPNLGENAKDRILVAINQCDVAMKGRYWNQELNRPEPQLEEFLNEKVQSVKRRIQEGTGVDIEPIYYSAGWSEDGEKQNPYNLTKLLYFILEHTKKEKRLVYADKLSQKSEVWKSNDDLKNYSEEVKESFGDALADGIEQGAKLGGAIAGAPGKVVGAVLGGVVKAGWHLIKSFFSWF